MGKAMDLSQTTVHSGVEPDHASRSQRWSFVLALVSLCLISFTAALDGSMIATALPRITADIKNVTSSDYVWIANCFLLAETVVQPPLAQLCNIINRKTPMLVSLVFFALGSGIAGGSHGVAMLVIGRTIQGLGAGGIFLLIEMIVCDLVPMRERPKYLGIVLSMTSVGAVLGPIVGGALANTNWRWVFYLNLPIAGSVLVIMTLSLRIPYTQASLHWRQALARVDWIGGLLFITSTCSLLLGLVFGGTQFSWSSWRTILPLVLGVLGLAGFQIYEASSFCKEASVPTVLFKNRTSVTGFLLQFISSILLQWVAFFLPFYFQSVREEDPQKAGIDFLPFQAFLIPAAMVAGFTLTKTGLYKPLHYLGFALTTLSVGLLTLLSPTSSTAVWVIIQALNAIGQGIITPSLLPAIQASLAESEVATSTGVYSFLRSFGWTWGITIPSIIFNNQWNKFSDRISDSNVRAKLMDGTAYRFAANMYQHPFDANTRREVISVYSTSIRTVWVAAIPFAGLGFLLVFLEKQLKLRDDLDTEFGLEKRADQPHKVTA